MESAIAGSTIDDGRVKTPVILSASVIEWATVRP
jgi:hypothetical protein